MSRRTPLLRAARLLGCAALLLSACKSTDEGAAGGARSQPSSSAAASAAPAAAVNDDSPLSVAKRLAMAKATGGQPADREITSRQKSLEGKSAELADPWVLLGRAWVKKARESSDPGYYLNAKACADVALEIAPPNRAALNLQAIVLMNQHKFDEARDLATRILSISSSHDIQALGTLSDTHLETGHYAEAQEAAQKMMDLKPNLPSYVRISYLQWLRGETQAALASARGAIDAGKDPNDPEPRCWALTQAAVMFWSGGDIKGADAGFEAATRECPDYPPALAGRGRVALAGGDHARAVDFLSKSFAQSPLAETAWLLGDARELAGDAKGAEESFAKVVKIGKGSDPRTLSLFWSTKDREHDEAVKLAEAEKKVRDDIWTEEALAWALYRAGKIPEAKAAIEKATALGTKDPRLLYHAGAIKIAAGDKDLGMKLVKEALSLNAKFDVTGAAEAEKLVSAK